MVLSRRLSCVTRLDLWRCPARTKLEVDGRKTCKSEPVATEGSVHSLPPYMRRQFLLFDFLTLPVLAAIRGLHESTAVAHDP